MDIEFDPNKDAINCEKHGLSLAEAAQLEWETLIAEPDERSPHGEQRMVGFVLMGDRLHCVVYTDRDVVRRIISLRKANTREVKRYANQV